MTFSELIKHLTDNLTDEQKAMGAEFMGDDGSTYTVDTVLVVAVGEGAIAEGQPIMANFGKSEE